MENESRAMPTTDNVEISEINVVQEKEKTGDNTSVETIPAERRCPNCQALLTEKQIFCPECGMSLKRFCSGCKTELQEGQIFCPSCGRRVEEKFSGINQDIAQFNAGIEKKKSKKKIMPVVLGIVGGIAVVAVFVTINTIKTEKIEKYMADAESFVSLAIEAGSNLEDIADTTQDYWYDAIWNDKYNDNINTAILYAMKDKAEEVATAKQQYTTMESLYKRLKNVPDGVENENLEEICDAVKELYNDYTDFYDFATDPSGNYNSFSSANKEKTDAFLSSYRALDNLID